MKTRVLIAEPDELLAECYERYLLRQGFDVETAVSGPQCVEKLRSCRPDVLLLEPDLGDGWGDRLLALLRERFDGHCVPVVILSRHNATPFEFPVCEYYVKPFPMTTLANSILRIAGDGHGRPEGG
jgi:DNA-binding response OmpR family regulator